MKARLRKAALFLVSSAAFGGLSSPASEKERGREGKELKNVVRVERSKSVT